MDRSVNDWKNNRRQMFLVVLTCCALIGWGELYPQFTLVKGTYAVFDKESGKEISEESDGSRVYWEILAADRGQIYCKSKLLSKLRTLQEQRRESYESGVR